MSVSFGISWIYEEFHAVRMNHGKCLKDWRSPTPVTNLREFSEALNAACRALDMRRGGDVAIAYESDEHTHTFLDLPPMSDRDMEKYLSHRVEQEKQFEELRPGVFAVAQVRLPVRIREQVRITEKAFCCT